MTMMAVESSSQTLNRLLVILYRSLPMYLTDAVPWTSPEDEPARRALADLVADYRISTDRISNYLRKRRHPIDLGEFPMEFTDLHDLAMDYLLTQLVEYQRRDLESVIELVSSLRGDPEARALAEEVQGNVRGHLEILEELVRKKAAATSSTVEGGHRMEPVEANDVPASELKSVAGKGETQSQNSH